MRNSKLVKVAVRAADRADSVKDWTDRARRLRRIAATVATLGEDGDFRRFVQDRKVAGEIVPIAASQHEESYREV